MELRLNTCSGWGHPIQPSTQFCSILIQPRGYGVSQDGLASLHCKPSFGLSTFHFHTSHPRNPPAFISNGGLNRDDGVLQDVGRGPVCSARGHAGRGVCVGGTAFPKVCFPRWCRGTLGRGFLRHPWGWAGRGRPVGLRRKTVSVLRLPESPARAERAPLGGYKAAHVPPLPHGHLCTVCGVPEPAQLSLCPDSPRKFPQPLGSWL